MVLSMHMGQTKKQSRVTLRDVAKDAEVSRSTASLVLNDSDRIPETTKRRVRASIEKLGYIYNHKAASLRTQRSQTVGVIVTDLSNPFYAELIRGINRGLQANGYAALLGDSDDLLATQNAITMKMLERMVDGLIIVPAEGTSAESLRTLVAGTPTVTVARYVSGADLDYIGIDNELGARRAVERFVEKGHERIAFIGGSLSSSARRDRLRGYRGILESHSLPFDEALTVTSSVTRQGGFDAVQPLLELPTPPTAALCYNDVVAFGVMLGLRKRGVEPGRDFAVIGFDDVAETALWSPPLATVAPNQPMGEAAARLILERIDKPTEETRQVIMPSTLILRESAGLRG